MHRAERTAAKFAETGKRTMLYRTLKAKVDGGDEGARADFLLVRLQLGLLGSDPALKELGRLVDVSKEQRKGILDLITNLEVGEITARAGAGNNELAAAAAKLLELKSDRRLPPGEAELREFWLVLLEYSELKKDEDLKAEGLAALRAAHGEKAAGLWAARRAERFSRAGYALYEEGKYPESIEKFKAAIEAAPEGATAGPAAYNAACSAALAGDAGEAVGWLGKAIALGYRNVDHMESDQDLKSIRSDERYKSLISRLREDLAQEQKSPRQRKLGFRTARVPDEARAYLPIKDGIGISVTEVVKDGLAEGAGLRKQDVIVTVNGEDAVFEDLEKALEPEGVRAIKLEILRKGQKLTVEIALDPQKAR